MVGQRSGYDEAREQLLVSLMDGLRFMVMAKCAELIATSSLKRKIDAGAAVLEASRLMSECHQRWERLGSVSSAKVRGVADSSPSVPPFEAKCTLNGLSAAVSKLMFAMTDECLQFSARFKAAEFFRFDEATKNVIGLVLSLYGKEQVALLHTQPLSVQAVKEEICAMAHSAVRTRPRRHKYALNMSLSASVSELAMTHAGCAEVLHFIAWELEIAAAEVCSANVVLFANMPVQFLRDMAEQISDECRHANLAYRRFRSYGGNEVCRAASLTLWNRVESADTLLQRLAVQQVVQEGNGLDAAHALAASFRASEDEVTACMVEHITLDEVSHVRLGNYWVSELLPPGDREAYLKEIDFAAASIQTTVPGRHAVSGLRSQAGFPADYLTLLCERAQQ